MASTKRVASGVVVERLECVVDGGAVLDADTGRVDLVDPGDPSRDVVSLFVGRGDLGLYPIGSRVRVTVERLP